MMDHSGILQSAKPATAVKDEEIKTLWMGDMAYWMDESFLFNAFASSGEVTNTKVIRNKVTGQTEGYGFIEFRTHETAAKVLQECNGKLIPQTEQMFRLNWAQFGVGKSGMDDYSIFVGDLAPEITDFDLQAHFAESYQSVRSAKVITDVGTGRHKGYGFVRFQNEEERDKALVEMNGKPLGGRQIRVSVATARKSIGGSCGDSSSSMSSTSSNYAVETAESANTTLFVGGLSEDVTEQDLIEAFAPHGQLGKGCGFVQYAYRPCAVNAKNAIHGQVIGKSPVRISWGRQQGLRYNKIGQNNMNHQAHQHVPHQFGYPQGFYQGYYDPSLAAYFGPYAGYYPRMPAMDPAMYQAYHAAAMPAMAAFPGYPQMAASATAVPQPQVDEEAQSFQTLSPVDIQRMNNMFIDKPQMEPQMVGRHLQVN